jgi:hypothetical protein
MVEGNDGQRHNLFHLTCTIGGKVCKLINDGGCCENVVAGKAVQKQIIAVLLASTQGQKMYYSVKVQD